MAFPTGWSKKQKITIDNTKVSGSSDLTNFPVFLTEDNFLTAAFSNSQGKEINSNYLLDDANLQGYWRLESDGTDSSGNGYDLTLNNTPTFTTGKFGNGVDLELSSSQSLSIADASCANLEISGSQTWSCWIKLESTASDMKILSKSSATVPAQLRFLSTGTTIRWALGGLTTNTLVDANTNFVTGIWYHVVGRYDSSATELSIWVNGVKDNSVTASGSHTDTDADFYIGDDETTGSEYFDGIIDDVAIWDRALSDEEVLSIFTGGADIRFSSDIDGDTQLAHEIVNWDIDGSTAEVHVKIPTLSYNSDTDFYVWYDNSSVTPQARDLANYGSDAVWTDYEGVYHGSNFADSSSNIYDLIPTNSPVIATGKVGSAFDFESGDSDYLTVTDPTNLQITGNITIQCWFYSESAQAEYNIVALAGADDTESENDLYRIGADGSEELLAFWEYGAGTNVSLTTSTLTFSQSTWYFITQVRNVTANTVDFYRNGSTEQESFSNDPTGGNNADFLIGARGSGVNPFDGLVDEVRVRTGTLSSDWIATEYNNQNSPSTFATATEVSTFTPKIIFY